MSPTNYFLIVLIHTLLLAGITTSELDSKFVMVAVSFLVSGTKMLKMTSGIVLKVVIYGHLRRVANGLAKGFIDGLQIPKGLILLIG